MKRLTIGILAHVDSGKTTLSEALLYNSGAIRSLGRVDHKNTFLDTNAQERSRGITIFSKQASFKYQDLEITLIDTPGHVDFSAETERTLQVLDAAILLISAANGVQSHTETLWSLLKKHKIPTIIFVNKMDLSNADKETLMSGIHKNLSTSAFDFETISNHEDLAVTSEYLMSKFLENSALTDKDIRFSFQNAEIFPCVFGSALKLSGIDSLLECISKTYEKKEYPSEFGARIYKITHDENGARLTHLKVTGGNLNVKDTVTYTDSNGNTLSEKIEQIRIYNSDKFTPAPSVYAGEICTVLGITSLVSGNTLGIDAQEITPVLTPILSYKVLFPASLDCHKVLSKLRILEAEDPTLKVSYNEDLGEIHILLMGEIQLEIISKQIKDRFDFDISFGEGSIVYRETITDISEGIGHYEPLRHYSEVHLKLEPIERGEGLIFDTNCDSDELERNWQRLILTHLEEKTHLGVLTGSPITDMKITLMSGKAHKKHTDGGDFRQATYRAVRQGLMKAKSVLLEPYYNYSITVPTENIGRVMTDIQKMCGTLNPPETFGENSTVKGTCPASKIRSYITVLSDFSHGKGKIVLTYKGYDICHNQDEVVNSFNYNPESDVNNSPDSIFCQGGGAIFVRWSDVESYMHLPSIFTIDKEKIEERKELKRRAAEFCAAAATDKELMEIFERTYGKIKDRAQKQKTKFNPSVQKPTRQVQKMTPKPAKEGPEYLLVDGYNIIFAWDEMKKTASSSLEYARCELIDRLCNYQGFCKQEIILVFDAYKVHKNPGSVEDFRNIKVVYTKEAETADTYIEKAAYNLSKNHIVRVATSDGPEQMIILGNGALRVPALSFIKEITDAEKAIRDYLEI